MMKFRIQRKTEPGFREDPGTVHTVNDIHELLEDIVAQHEITECFYQDDDTPIGPGIGVIITREE